MPRSHPTCIRVARKDHTCTENSYHTIRKGDRYLYAACAPEHEMNRSRKSDPGGKRWWVIKACLRCADTYGLHTSDTRKQLETLNAGEKHTG